MKKWEELNTLERFDIIEACDNMFHKTEGTLTRIEYVKAMYDLIYEKNAKGPINE